MFGNSCKKTTIAMAMLLKYKQLISLCCFFVPGWAALPIVFPRYVDVIGMRFYNFQERIL